MKEIKLKERFTNAFDAFFDNQKLTENTALDFSNNDSIFHGNKSSPVKLNSTWKIFKQIFLFLPGAFILFFMSIAFTGFFLLRPSPAGTNRGLLIALIVFLTSVLMTVIGLGNFREPKHFSIPLSIISIGVILGIIGSVFFGLSEFGHFIQDYVPYFIPLAYIAPVLVKGWVDKPEENL